MRSAWFILFFTSKSLNLSSFILVRKKKKKENKYSILGRKYFKLSLFRYKLRHRIGVMIEEWNAIKAEFGKLDFSIRSVLKKDKSCTSHRLWNIFQHEEYCVAFELSEYRNLYKCNYSISIRAQETVEMQFFKILNALTNLLKFPLREWQIVMDVLLNSHSISAKGESQTLCCMMGRTMSPFGC